MKALFDTSVLIAGTLKTHPHHAACRPWLVAAKTGLVEMVVCNHSLAEYYRVVSILPQQPIISTAALWRMIEDSILQWAALVELTSDDYLECLAQASQAGYRSGIIYDALIVRAAVNARVDRLLTINLQHFQRIWPYDPDAIINPLTTPAP
jgi:predicted nucleic acid-binding protein